MPDSPLDRTVLDRLDRLERANRRYRLALLGAGCLCLGWAACSVGADVKNVLAAERFALVATDGSEKAALELDQKGNPMLTLRSGSSFALLTASGPALLLRGADGKTGAFVGIDSRNASRLELCSHRLLDGVRLTTHEDGSAGVYVLDVNGRERGGLESYSKGGAALNFRDAQGKMRAHMGIGETSLPDVLLLDEAGGRRLGMLVLEDGNPLLEIADPRGDPRIQLTTLFDGSPRLQLLREDGSPSFEAP
jgi:hypothetical protein